ncbi:MAG: hypothetical protein HY245_15150 [Rhizobiales bacterium]|nr:hypothetical protein [Hyphomicrobiales bacterium]MBI3674725.1 hypothetical protein [Hyphomicrobiales bacterium]
MKITITVDCTPEEARTFMGLPDLAALQQPVLQAMQEQLRQQMSSDPETAMKAWFGPGLQNLTDMQKAYWQQFFKSSAPASE